jgi:phage terminase large subunit-like protein
MSTKDMVDFLTNSLKLQAKTPNLHAYIPHSKQSAFHKSDAKGRLYIGGNRSGKSVGGVVEDLWWATGRHPYIKTPELPIHGRIIGVDFINGIQGILLPIFKRWIVPSDLINGSWEDSWHNLERTLTLANGSILDFKSNDQDLEKHAGTSRNFIHFDEEPPRAYFIENLLRLVDTGGSWWITMTPVMGMTWIYAQLYEKWKKGHVDNFEVIEVDMADNPYLSETEKAAILGFLNADERSKREHGNFIPRGGLVYPDFEETKHATIRNWKPPKDWMVYQSTDHGYNNPAAHLWHAVSPDGLTVVTFHEMYGSERIVKEWAADILKWEAENGIEIFLRTGDPAMKQRQAVTGTSIASEYADCGIYFSLDSVPRDVAVGVNRITQYLQVNPHTKQPFWQIDGERCKNLTREMLQLQWAYYESAKLADSNNKQEKIKKKDDHAPDSARYFFTFLPDLGSMVDTTIDPIMEALGNGGIQAGTIWEFIARAKGPESNFGPTSTEWMTQEGFSVMPDDWDDDF